MEVVAAAAVASVVEAVAGFRHQEVARSSRPTAKVASRFLAAAQRPCSHARAR